MRERKSARLRNYDYSQTGYYFMTICAKNREEWFGKVKNGEMCLNEYGEVAKNLWSEIPVHFKGVRTDEFSVMPNHVHGILIIEEKTVGNAYMRSLQRDAFMHPLQDRTKMLLSKIIQQYKASVSRKINSPQNDYHFQWQKSFYDHVIRSEKSLENLRVYITYNPLKWELDIENRETSRLGKSKDYYREIIDGR